jgi:hypothetical protein
MMRPPARSARSTFGGRLCFRRSSWNELL